MPLLALILVIGMIGCIADHFLGPDLRITVWVTVLIMGLVLLLVYTAGYLLWYRHRQSAQVPFRTIFEQAPIGIALVDRETGCLTHCNEHLAKILGRGQEASTRRDSQGPTHPDDPLVDSDLQARLNAGEINSYRMERRYLRPDGSVLWGDLTVTALATGTGQPRDCLVLFEDITERREADERLRAITDAAHDAILMMNPQGVITYWNPAATLILGYRPEEALGQNLHRLLAPDRYLAAHLGAFPEYQHSGRGGAVGKTIELFARRKDGQELAVELSLSSVVLKDGWNAVGVLRDITERKRMEEQLRLSEERYRLIADHATDVIWTMGVDGRLTYVSPSVERLRGFTPAEVMQQSMAELMTPESLPRALAGLEGTVLSARAGHHPVEFFRDEFEQPCKDGSTVWTEMTANGIYNAEGQFVELLGITRDISHRKRYEQGLQQARKAAEAANAAKSVFLAHMSHEIRTPLNAVLGLAQVLERTLPGSDQREMVAHIGAAGRSLLGIVNDILDLSKIEAGQLQLEDCPIELVPLLSRLEAMLEPMARDKGLELSMAVPPRLNGSLRGDPLRLEQVLVNLIGNAIKFTDQGGIRVRIDPLETGDRGIRLRFTVSDTGIGIKPETMASLFTPFTQGDASITRRFGGTGLGLSISKRLVKLMGGEIGVESQVGQGSTFWFELPFDLIPDDLVPGAPIPGVPAAPPASDAGADEAKPCADGPAGDGIDSERLARLSAGGAAKLVALRSALGAHRPRAARQLFAELEAELAPVAGPTAIRAMAEAMSVLRFQEALSILEGVTNTDRTTIGHSDSKVTGLT